MPGVSPIIAKGGKFGMNNPLIAKDAIVQRKITDSIDVKDQYLVALNHNKGKYNIKTALPKHAYSYTFLNIIWLLVSTSNLKPMRHMVQMVYWFSFGPIVYKSVLIDEGS